MLISTFLAGIFVASLCAFRWNELKTYYYIWSLGSDSRFASDQIIDTWIPIAQHSAPTLIHHIDDRRDLKFRFYCLESCDACRQPLALINESGIHACDCGSPAVERQPFQGSTLSHLNMDLTVGDACAFILWKQTGVPRSKIRKWKSDPAARKKDLQEIAKTR